MTSAPLSASASAIAMPILPDEKFPINRTGSNRSYVGPAVTSALTPVNGFLPCSEKNLKRIQNELRNHDMLFDVIIEDVEK